MRIVRGSTASSPTCAGRGVPGCAQRVSDGEVGENRVEAQMSNSKRRFWIEAGTAVATAVMALLTLVWPDWIELIFRVDPDGGNGALEWAIVAGPVFAAAPMFLLARGGGGRGPRARRKRGVAPHGGG